MMPWLRRLVLVVMLLMVTSLSPVRAFAQVADPNLWVTNGDVYAMALDGNTLYIGGFFTDRNFLSRSPREAASVPTATQ